MNYKDFTNKRPGLITCLLLPLMLLISCGKETIKGPLETGDGTPGKLTNIQVENLPGASKISYTLPDDPSVLYVLAEFSTQQGELRIAKSSVYTDNIVLEGFASTDEQQVTLYVVNRSEVRSEPIEVKINPLLAPIHEVYEELVVLEDFGGIKLQIRNDLEREYVLYTLRKNENGIFESFDRLYTNSKLREYLMTGLPAEPMDFAFVLMDKWQNKSDTLYKTLTPLYEEKLDKSKWNLKVLDNDTYLSESSDNPRLLWDDITTNRFRLRSATPDPPHWLTIDIGQTAMLSRIRVNAYWTSNGNWLFNRQSPRYFEIWASNNPSQSGSWENWDKLGSYESVKPSGLPLGEFTNEDLAVGAAGEDFTLPYNGVSYRYIRFVTISTWDTRPNTYWGELTLWGNPEDE
ncbi:DUF5000 domain-containing lipoprotein [Niabella terrae]